MSGAVNRSSLMREKQALENQYFPEEESNLSGDSITRAVSDLIRGGEREFISPCRYFFPAITGVLERVFFFLVGC